MCSNPSYRQVFSFSSHLGALRKNDVENSESIIKKFNLALL